MSNLPLIKSPDTARKNRIPPGQRLTTGWPVLHHGPVQLVDMRQWTFTIKGLVDKPRTLSFEEFTALPQVQVFSDIHCVTTWSRLDNLWEGIPTSALKSLVAIRPEAKFVVVHAAGNFTTNLPIEDFFQDDVLFALKHDGQLISREHGGPVRLVVPRLYFWKSAKWANGVEFVARDQPGFWESVGYHNHGDPWKEERYG
jgi:DMSO/TMAO reductase YedYZ molybdopterin-dependent catalytic subunit